MGWEWEIKFKVWNLALLRKRDDRRQKGQPNWALGYNQKNDNGTRYWTAIN